MKDGEYMWIEKCTSNLSKPIFRWKRYIFMQSFTNVVTVKTH